MIDTKHDATLYVGFIRQNATSHKNQDPAMSTGQPNSSEDFEALISAAGRALAALRVVRTKHCASCGREFAGISKARYCSEACRAKAWRKGRKQANEKAEA
jgi:predicted nucleic acid-binding Zn ribbon protein